jgi:hypothetical protein
LDKTGRLILDNMNDNSDSQNNKSTDFINDEDKSRRRKLLIDPKFQIWFIGYTSLIGVMAIVGLYLANLYLFSQYAEMGVSANLSEDHVYFAFLHKQKQSMTMIYLIATGILLILSAVYGLILSNRIAGPLYNLRLYLQRWMYGNRSEQLIFREADHFQDLANAINKTLNTKNPSKKPE